ncbi:MAG TPA: beta-ketoacyl-[acyl-carrier-protein] synthase II, partial [Cyanobacteria bacterium UBA12227]|nr:beta-ketoacyl-[acyl-carrier-protein] synthase II [Cyanobacteria bacterium UBA12227]
ITFFDASRHTCRIAGEVKGFNPHDFMDRKEAKRMDRFAQFAVAASKQALADAQFVINEL